MNGLVLELQADVLRDTTPVSSLLRKALLICRKLRQTESLAWIEAELNGYTGTPIPEYRMVRGEIRVTTRHGPIPYVFTKSPEVAELLSRRPVDLSVPELEALLSSSGDWFENPYPPEIEADFLQRSGVRPVLQVPRSTLLGILSRVRTGLLEWTAQLESSGVIGNGLSFTAEEVQAASAPSLHIENYIGSVVNSSVQQNIATSQPTLSSTDGQALRESLEALQTVISRLSLPHEALAQLDADIRTMLAQAAAPSPNRGVLATLWHPTREVLQHAAGHVVGVAAAHQLPELLARVSALLT